MNCMDNIDSIRLQSHIIPSRTAKAFKTQPSESPVDLTEASTLIKHILKEHQNAVGATHKLQTPYSKAACKKSCFC
ncbi:hypothetical protein L484_025116 [Morus notabilis]|uniref:Uncharacterized protein n=1 Tax=Morus notabilis TaxID=981085 RepID=W9RL36_9ROSA|nr:hypothetical protein L484_025116 [Morus notabilis]